jgi:pimeloyl-ACP methyl ester carboxylesterase
MFNAPFYPIVYVRGYAGSQSGVENTVATPYMGFNEGSTKVRQVVTRDVQRHIFESPLIRLMKDHGYVDTFNSGSEVEGEVAARSIWIYRYYEPVSKELGSGIRPEMEDYAEGLADFIDGIRGQICGPAESTDPQVIEARKDFRVHIVAHSMGGLIARSYLQKVAPDRAGHPAVDKVFTYATPHGGIDLRFVGNVPSFLTLNNIENFNESRMREYLDITDKDTPVNDLDGEFPPDRFFCLVGTNSTDYGAAMGLSSAAVGPMSDGLVQIGNAALRGAPRAFVHRSHSGHYGIVNSEEGYQNLRRFLFGQDRIDVYLQLDEVTVPAKVNRAMQDGKKLRASYHIEVVAGVRGARWDLHRRKTTEMSARYVDWTRIRKAKEKPMHLLSAYLMRDARVNRRRRSLGFSLEVGVLVPEYVIDNRIWLDDHYEGGYLFREKVNFELTTRVDAAPRLKYGFDSTSPNTATRFVNPERSWRLGLQSSD